MPLHEVKLSPDIVARMDGLVLTGGAFDIGGPGRPPGGGGRDVVFEVHLDDPHDLVGWQVFGGTRVAGLYPAGVSQG